MRSFREYLKLVQEFLVDVDTAQEVGKVVVYINNKPFRKLGASQTIQDLINLLNTEPFPGRTDPGVYDIKVIGNIKTNQKLSEIAKNDVIEFKVEKEKMTIFNYPKTKIRK